MLEEFGYFAFGGSNIVVMFEADKVKVTAQVGTHYNQGHGGYKLHTRPGRLRNSGVRESSIRGESSICQGSK